MRYGRFRPWAVLIAALIVAAGAGLSATAQSLAPATEHFERVWHFGRVTGDLEAIIAFYQDFLGLALRGSREAQLQFLKNASLDEFVDGPPGAEFRAVHFLIPGASAATDPAESMSIEAFEYRGIDRQVLRPVLSQPGVSSLRFMVTDLDRAAATARSAGVAFVTPGDSPVEVPAPAGLGGVARAVMLQDPDGYPVELMQLDPAPDSLAPRDSLIQGAMMVVVVRDLDTSLRFYREFFGVGLQSTAIGHWHRGDGVEALLGIATTEHRSTYLKLPGSALWLELLQFKGCR